MDRQDRGKKEYVVAMNATANASFNIKPEPSDYTVFYVWIVICTIIGTILLLVNWICCCCSKHTPYWSDPDTGNRFASLLFIRKPKTRPLDVLLE